LAIHFSFHQADFQLGVISDTHGLLRPEALELLQGVDMIIHAGDIGPPEILETLKAIAPVAAVRGNMDGGPLGMILPDAESIEIGTIRIHVLHDLNRMHCNPATEGIGMVINGHTHRPLLHTVQEVIYLNPGSAGPRRLGLPVSLARVNFNSGRISVRHIDLDQHRLYGTEASKPGSNIPPNRMNEGN
jgi:putative phosphoesterase